MTKKKEPPPIDLSNSRGAPDQLRSFVERWETLEADKKATTEEQKDLMAEAKGVGFDTKVMRRIIMERKRDADEVAEEESILELYRQALGMGVYATGEDDGLV